MSKTARQLDAEIESIVASSTVPVRRSSRVVVSQVDPDTMTAGQINKELDRLDSVNGALTDEMISAGRGHERPSDYSRMTDPLSSNLSAVSARRQALRSQVERRFGPGAPRRLPAGFGPIR